jgi:hypothetical protein
MSPTSDFLDMLEKAVATAPTSERGGESLMLRNKLNDSPGLRAF